MMEMTAERWEYTSEYLRDVFGQQDEHLEGLMDEAVAAGLPDIAVSADVGRLLKLLVSTTRARLALEIGTLGGYSAIWIARGLAGDGRLITIEKDHMHADFAERQLERAGVAGRIELLRGGALDVLDTLADRVGPGALDFVFVDAVKTEYVDYFRKVRPWLADGGIFVADNILGAGDWWIDDEGHEAREAVHALSRTLAADPAFEAVGIPLRQGLLVARRTQ